VEVEEDIQVSFSRNTVGSTFGNRPMLSVKERIVDTIRYDIRYDSVYLTCSKKLTGSQLDNC